MNRRALTVAVLAIGLALTGCAATPEPTGTPEPAMSAPPEETTTAEVTPGPVQVTPQPVEETERTEEVKQAQFVRVLQEVYPELGLTGEQLLSAAFYVCEQRSAGAYVDTPLEGADADTNATFVSTAIAEFCPEVLD